MEEEPVKQKDIREVGRSEKPSDMVGKAVVSKEMPMRDQSRTEQHSVRFDTVTSL